MIILKLKINLISQLPLIPDIINLIKLNYYKLDYIDLKSNLILYQAQVLKDNKVLLNNIRFIDSRFNRHCAIDYNHKLYFWTDGEPKIIASDVKSAYVCKEKVMIINFDNSLRGTDISNVKMIVAKNMVITYDDKLINLNGKKKKVDFTIRYQKGAIKIDKYNMLMFNGAKINNVKHAEHLDGLFSYLIILDTYNVLHRMGLSYNGYKNSTFGIKTDVILETKVEYFRSGGDKIFVKTKNERVLYCGNFRKEIDYDVMFSDDLMLKISDDGIIFEK